MLLWPCLWLSVVPFIRTPSKGRPMQAEIPSVLVLVKLFIPGDMGGKILTTKQENVLQVRMQKILFLILLEKIL